MYEKMWAICLEEKLKSSLVKTRLAKRSK